MKQISGLKKALAVSLAPLFSVFSQDLQAGWWFEKEGAGKDSGRSRYEIRNNGNGVKPGSSRIGSDLSTLRVFDNSASGSLLGNALDGQYHLVFFGAPYELYMRPEDRPPQVDMSRVGKNGVTMEAVLDEFQRQKAAYDKRMEAQGGTYENYSCAIDLAIISDVKKKIKAMCGAKAAERFTPIFVFPEYDPARHPPPVNIKTYIKAGENGILGLTGSDDEVMGKARQYTVRYRTDKDTGLITGHTRYTYLMGPDGRNLAIFPPDMLGAARVMAQHVVSEMRKDRNMALPDMPSCYAP